MKVVFCCPSYKRPKVKTLDYLSKIRIYVAPEEYEDYKKENPGADIVKCADGVQGSVCRVRNYILDEEFKKGAEAVCIVDDDMSGIYYMKGDKELKTISQTLLTEQEVYQIAEKYSQVCKDLGFYYWGMNCNRDSLSYRQYSPFSFKRFIGGPFQGFINDGGIRFDESLPLKEDYDMTLQQLNKYRGVLRCNFLSYDVLQAKQEGGCAMYRNSEREAEQFKLLQKKWGTKIVQMDKHSGRTGIKHRQFDFNPIIRPPIKGI